MNRKRKDEKMGEITLRITRNRTPGKGTVLEALEREAEAQGISLGSLALIILAAHKTIQRRMVMK